MPSAYLDSFDPPLSSSIRTHSAWPPSHATCSGIRPSCARRGMRRAGGAAGSYGCTVVVRRPRRRRRPSRARLVVPSAGRRLWRAEQVGERGGVARRGGVVHQALAGDAVARGGGGALRGGQRGPRGAGVADRPLITSWSIMRVRSHGRAAGGTETHVRASSAAAAGAHLGLVTSQPFPRTRRTDRSLPRQLVNRSPSARRGATGRHGAREAAASGHCAHTRTSSGCARDVVFFSFCTHSPRTTC